MATPQQSAIHSVRFPHESDSYRAARNDLLRAELALRKQIEAVAELRRTLPLGGVVPQDYSFEEGAAETDKVSASHTVRLSELFRPGKDTLVVYSSPPLQIPTTMITVANRPRANSVPL